MMSYTQGLKKQHTIKKPSKKEGSDILNKTDIRGKYAYTGAEIL